MRMKMVLSGLAALLLAGTASAQGGGGQPRAPRTPEPSVAPIIVRERVAPTLSAIAPALQPENTWVLDLSDGGRVMIQLRPDQAPGHVERIRSLTRLGFYNGLSFHRVIEGFMAQGGDPQGTGNGSSDLPDLAAELNPLPHLRGAVAMARAAEPNSANSQFYIMFAPASHLDGQYSIWGQVVQGMEFVDKIRRGSGSGGTVQNPDRITRVRVMADAKD